MTLGSQSTRKRSTYGVDESQYNQMVREEKKRQDEEKKRIYDSFALSRLCSIQEIRSDLYSDTFFNPTVTNLFQSGQASLDSFTSGPMKYNEMLESTATDYSTYQKEYEESVNSFTSAFVLPSVYQFYQHFT